MSEVRSLNWNDLKIFYMVAHCGTLAEASERLNVNHSTVFRRINTMEGVLGIKLFDRRPDGYLLSNVGMKVHEHVEQIEGTISDIYRLVDNYNNKLQGVINLTAPHNFAYRYLPKIICDFQNEYPDIHVNLLVTNKDCDLSKREADLAIRASASPPDNLIGIKLFSFRWSVYGSPQYLQTRGRPTNEKELLQHHMISVHHDLEFLPAFRWIHQNIPDKNIVSRCNDLISISSLALAGVGLAILPDDQNKPGLEKLFEVDFADNSDIWILSHPNMRDCLRLKTFKRYLINSFGKDADIQSNIYREA